MKKRSFRAEREFGLVVGGVFVLLSAWWIYRSKLLGVVQVTLPLGALLVLFGLLYPKAFIWPNRAWMKFAEGLSYVSTRIILVIVFFGILTPIGLIKKALGWDPLRRRASSTGSYWHPYSERQRDSRHYEKMY